MEKRYIGSDCYIRYSSRAELTRSDESLRVSLTSTEYKILSDFIDNIYKPMKLEDLARFLWGTNYGADKKDPESIKSHISRIRGKLNKINPALKKRFETNYGYNTYTFKPESKDCISDSLEIEVFENIDINTEIVGISNQMDMLVEKLEKLQEKIDRAKSEKSSIWERVYSAQFQTTFSLLMSLQEEVEEKRMKLKNLFLHRSASAPRRPEGTTACIPNAMIMVKSDLFDLKNWMDSSIAKVDCIEAQLDEAICEYLSSGCCDYDFLEDVLLDLPLSREVAVALYRLTESFDGMLELYEVIFDKYTGFLTDSELSHLLDRAKKVWEPMIWKRWEA